MTTLLLLVVILAVSSLLGSVEAGSNEASKAWLAENAKKDGVHVLPSGLQYRVLRKVCPHIRWGCACSHLIVVHMPACLLHILNFFTPPFSLHAIRARELITRRSTVLALVTTREH